MVPSALSVFVFLNFFYLQFNKTIQCMYNIIIGKIAKLLHKKQNYGINYYPALFVTYITPCLKK